jgi:hypothetical protein
MCRGDLRDEAFHAALDQGLARDASFLVISAVDLATLDDHGYREAQLCAGLVGARLHLMAYALGVGASGMTFHDARSTFRYRINPLHGARIAWWAPS